MNKSQTNWRIVFIEWYCNIPLNDQMSIETLRQYLGKYFLYQRFILFAMSFAYNPPIMSTHYFIIQYLWARLISAQVFFWLLFSLFSYEFCFPSVRLSHECHSVEKWRIMSCPFNECECRLTTIATEHCEMNAVIKFFDEVFRFLCTPLRFSFAAVQPLATATLKQWLSWKIVEFRRKNVFKVKLTMKQGIR